MDNRETSGEDVVFEYTGDGCSVPKDVTSVSFKEGLQKIGNYAFRDGTSLKRLNTFGHDCRSLQSVKLPSTLVEIGINAFNSCSSLKEVTFNDGLQKIGDRVFCNCSSLKSITLPSTLVEIGVRAFWNCSNLREVTINNGLQKIGNWAFDNCSSLESITLPSTVTEIGVRAFRECSNLREVELNGVPQSVKSDTFGDCDALERFLFTTISYRLDNIIQTSHWDNLEDKLNEVRGVVQWESNKLFVAGIIPHNWDIIRRDLDRITRLVSYYELKEATSMFELALWKSKLEADATNTTNRAVYRMDVPGPVKDTMLQYLDHTC